MAPTDINELVVLLAEAGRALGDIVTAVEQHPLDSPADGAVVIVELVQSVADVLGPEKFGRLVDLAERLDGDAVARRDVAVIIASLPLVEALPVRQGLQLLEKFQTYANHRETRGTVWDSITAEQAIRTASPTERGH